MKKCLIWGTGECFYKNISLIKYHENVRHFKVVGITSNNCLYSNVYGYKFISKKEIKKIKFDIIIIFSDNKYKEKIYYELLKLGISDKKVFMYNILNYSNLNVSKVIKLKKNPPSIFSINCWGGIVYHSFGLKFTSPFINMYLDARDYLKFLKKPKKYLKEELKFDSIGYDKTAKKSFPIAKCGDILLYFNHYDTFEYAKECWDRRKKRVNWKNIFVMLYTESQSIAKEFSKLPFKKKVCFVPFESNDDSITQIEFCDKKEFKDIPFWKIVNGIARLEYPYYDILHLLETGKIKKISKIKE